MKIVSLFSGCGGLDLGFSNAGFQMAFANDNDRDVWETYEANHGLEINKKSISEIDASEIPDAVGIIGGPPCQSWSLAGAMRGIKDKRGQLFYEYIRILKEKQPLFFLAENVAGILSSTHLPEFKKIIAEFEKLGYNVSYKLVNAKDYGVPQDRKRVIIVGYHKSLKKSFQFPLLSVKAATLKDAIANLPNSMPAKEKNYANESIKVANHEHMNGGFSTLYMSRNRRRSWNEPSFTIQAGGRHAPLHPGSCEMIRSENERWKFSSSNKNDYRRLSVRECARIQTFPDSFIFKYKNIAAGYKMIGNAVPVRLGEVFAKKIMEDLKGKREKMVWSTSLIREHAAA